MPYTYAGKVLQNIFIFIIRAYQYLLSPWLGSNCRFTPTCSNYCIEAIRVHGNFKGLVLSVKRILRCHPWGGRGYDPVPEKYNA